MADGARRMMTIDDLLSLGEEARADCIRGEIVHRLEPSFAHEDPVDSLVTELRSRFRGPRGPGGSSGWWIGTSLLIRMAGGEALCPDLAGWRRDRVSEKPREHPITTMPDWVCEVTVTTRRKDTTEVPRMLAENGVPWYWRIDVPTENLIVHELTDQGFVQRMSLFREDGKVRIPPFDAVELSVPVILGDDPDELG